jgi:hypothetical protein
MMLTGIKIENATSGTASWAGIELLPSNGAPNYVIATSQTHSSFPNELFLQNSYNGKFRFYGSASTTALFDGAGAFKYYYDNSNYLTSTVSSAGAVTFAATGASAGFSFNESILLPTTESVQFGNSSYRIDGEIGLGTVNIYTNNSKRFTVDNNGDTNLYSGNLSLGTALSINGTAPVIHLNDGNRYFDLLNDNSGNFKIKNVTAGNTIPFTVAGATDNVGINDITPDYRLDVETDSASTYVANFFNDGNNANRSGILVQAGLDDHTATGPSTLVGFQDGDGGVVGSITFGSSATAYNTTSDQRLKNLVNERTNSSLNILNQIKIHDFTWKDDLNNNLYTGVFAQELYNIYPHAVTKPINETDGWMVDYSKLTPIIVSSIQDLDLKIIGLASLDLSNSNSLGSLIKTFLSDSANTIENLYAKIIHSDRIETKELCVGATCVTETQFLQIVNGSGIISSPKTESTPEETPALDSVPDPNIETSPEPDPTPAPDQAPDSGPVIEQVPSTE